MIVNRQKIYCLGGSVLAVVLVIFGAIFLIRGCGRGKGQAVTRENVEQEYRCFINGGFDSLEEASQEAAAWMGRCIAIGEEERIDEAQAILNCFLEMQDFFARDFPSERSFHSQMEFMGKRFQDSPYPVVRNTWLRISSRY